MIIEFLLNFKLIIIDILIDYHNRVYFLLEFPGNLNLDS